MANLKLITILKNRLIITIIPGLMLFIPIMSIGNVKTQLSVHNLQSAGTDLSIQETNTPLPVIIPGGAGIDTVKIKSDMDVHYPGGYAAWKLFFKNNFNYSEEDQTNGINRVVTVKFIVSKKGSIKKAEIVNGLDKTQDKAILSVVNMMPDWSPFLKDGVAVEVPFELNILLYQESPYKDDVILDKQIEQQPQFPGGDYALMNFLRTNIRYPETAQEWGTSGTVNIGFVVRYSGKITNVKVLKGIGHGCDEESVRLIKMMPDWIPGKDKGKAVSTHYMVPVKFQLNTIR